MHAVECDENELLSKAANTLAHNFSSLKAHTLSFSFANESQFLQILSNPNLHVYSELEVYLAVKKYIVEKKLERKNSKELLKQVRLWVLSPTELEQVKKDGIIPDRMINEALLHLMLGKKMPPIRESYKTTYAGVMEGNLVWFMNQTVVYRSVVNVKQLPEFITTPNVDQETVSFIEPQQKTVRFPILPQYFYYQRIISELLDLSFITAICIDVKFFHFKNHSISPQTKLQMIHELRNNICISISIGWTTKEGFNMKDSWAYVGKTLGRFEHHYGKSWNHIFQLPTPIPIERNKNLVVQLVFEYCGCPGYIRFKGRARSRIRVTKAVYGFGDSISQIKPEHTNNEIAFQFYGNPNSKKFDAPKNWIPVGVGNNCSPAQFI